MTNEKLPPLSPEKLTQYDRQVMKSNLIGSAGHAAMYGLVGAFIGGIAGMLGNLFIKSVTYEIGVFMGFIVAFVMDYMIEYEKRKQEAIKYRQENYE